MKRSQPSNMTYLAPLFMGIIMGLFAFVIPSFGLPDCESVNPDFKIKCETFVTDTINWLKYLPPIFFAIGFFGGVIIENKLGKNESSPNFRKDALGHKV